MTTTSTEISDLLARHKAWEQERASYYEREEDNPVSSSTWEGSDDTGIELGNEAIHLLQQPFKVWTCAVKTPDSPGVVAFVRWTEDECFEALRELYDPEGEADDEPPVAIVGHLEDDGYVINVDVHEVTR